MTPKKKKAARSNHSGLFKSGVSGNPKGRPKGAANKVTQALKAIIHERGPEYLTLLFNRAKSELTNSVENDFRATKIVAAFVLLSTPTRKRIAGQAKIREQILAAMETYPRKEKNP